MIFWGQGEMHLRVALERLTSKYGAAASTFQREVPYKETIRKSAQVRGRHKKQSGGHGQFGAEQRIDFGCPPRRCTSREPSADERSGELIEKGLFHH